MEHFVWPALAGIILALCVSAAGAAEEPGPSMLEFKLTRKLREGHPRLFLTPESLEKLRQAVQADPAMKDLFGKLCAQADRVLNEPPVEHVLVGPRLLDKSRRCLDRVATLALVYRLGGDQKYAARALK